MVEEAKKPHPLKGRKKSAASIRKRLATLKAKREAKERGEIVEGRATTYRRRKSKHMASRTLEQLERDVGEAIWCLERAVMGKRKAIRDGLASLTDVTDEETFMYMAMRYLQGGLKS